MVLHLWLPWSNARSQAMLRIYQFSESNLKQCYNPGDANISFGKFQSQIQTSSIIRRLSIQSFHTSRNLHDSLLGPNVNRTRHHLLRQTRQTSSPNTDTGNTIASMHQSRPTVPAEVAPHNLPRSRGTCIFAQAVRICRLDCESREHC
jgi:hypothetical protein